MDVPEEFNIEDFVDDEPEDYNHRIYCFQNQFFMFVPDFVPDQISKNKLKSSKYA